MRKYKRHNQQACVNQIGLDIIETDFEDSIYRGLRVEVALEFGVTPKKRLIKF